MIDSTKYPWRYVCPKCKEAVMCLTRIPSETESAAVLCEIGIYPDERPVTVQDIPICKCGLNLILCNALHPCHIQRSIVNSDILMTISLTPELHARLRELSYGQTVTIQYVVLRALNDYVSQALSQKEVRGG